MNIGQVEKNTIPLKEILSDCGIKCTFKGIEYCPSYIIYHFNLYNITQLSKISKVVKYVSAYLHLNVEQRESDVGHFALAIEKTKKETIYFSNNTIQKQIMSDKPYSMIIGIDDRNQAQTISLNDVPHILIGGATGSGKSVLLNNMICSLIRKHNENELDLVLIDTKRVELGIYKDIPQLATPIVNNVDSAINTLEIVCKIMDDRYKKMEEMGIRNGIDHFSKLVVVIDELADLMITSDKYIEKYIVRIAQLGRACNINLIIATQRPTVDVVTGSIKANIPCRIALQTLSSRDSINILDHKGAENLKGKGDCLLKLPTEVKEIHLQCPFIRDEDIEKIIKGINNDNSNIEEN